MIVAIRNIVAGEGYLEFEVVADRDGADEIVVADLNGGSFSTRVQAPPSSATIHRIDLLRAGEFQVRLRAQDSGADSGLYTLYVKEPTPGTSWCLKHKKPKDVCRCP